MFDDEHFLTQAGVQMKSPTDFITVPTEVVDGGSRNGTNDELLVWIACSG